MQLRCAGKESVEQAKSELVGKRLGCADLQWHVMRSGCHPDDRGVRGSEDCERLPPVKGR
jgi:hypothetical protein